jgi:hypothetical protein
MYRFDYDWFSVNAPNIRNLSLGIDSFVNVYANKLRPVLGLTNTSSCFVKVAE